MNDELTIEINGEVFPIQKEVFDLIHNISFERDEYKMFIEEIGGKIKFLDGNYKIKF